MQSYHVLNLGAGVQSTALYLLARNGRLPCDVAIFADTGEEPQAVYRHLGWLLSLERPLWCLSNLCASEPIYEWSNEAPRGVGWHRLTVSRAGAGEAVVIGGQLQRR